ncbi:hypothetical protein NX059_011690 [Plenodomus lindquistii]|nr:hypothetical protein NX059_011690 [Plenodomus lindquistii]
MCDFHESSLHSVKAAGGYYINTCSPVLPPSQDPRFCFYFTAAPASAEPERQLARIGHFTCHQRTLPATSQTKLRRLVKLNPSPPNSSKIIATTAYQTLRTNKTADQVYCRLRTPASVEPQNLARAGASSVTIQAHAMPLFPPGTPHNIFDGYLDDWEAWRDGVDPGPMPPTTMQKTVEQGCEFIKDFTPLEGHSIEFKKEMKGHVLEQRTFDSDRVWARVFIKDVTEHGPNDADKDKWAPMSAIKVDEK